MKNYAESCERNKEPILAVLKQELSELTTVLEVGSGSGQHALYFAAQLSHLNWLPSERPELVADLLKNLSISGQANLSAPICLDVNRLPWEVEPVSAIFSANTLHIMSLDSVADFFRGAGAVLGGGGKLCVYGPFRYGGDYTSERNAKFDLWLKERDPHSGIRDFEVLDQFAQQQGMQLLNDHRMPSNNQLLVWQIRR